jgi:hypothetical protein
MKSRPPPTRVQTIERSLRCFDCGLFGLLPVIGLPFAVGAIANYRRVKRWQTPAWNPARSCLVWGLVCADTGLLLTLGVVLGIVCALTQD